jgi:hypothetical protein
MSTEVETSLNISELARFRNKNSQRFLPFDTLRSLRAGSQYGGCAAVKWMQRHVAARNDRKQNVVSVFVLKHRT